MTKTDSLLSLLPLAVLFTFLHGAVQAVNLYVSSYNGNITTLRLDGDMAYQPQHPHRPKRPQLSTYTLTKTYSFDTGTDSPSWLLLDPHTPILYLVSEAVTNNTPGALVTYQTSPSGALSLLQNLVTPPGGVHATFFAHGSALAVPHYSTGQLITYSLNATGAAAPSPLQTITYTLASPGPVANRQASPHPHEALLDPTGAYLLVPDLGADLVRVQVINAGPAGPTLRPVAPLVAAPGSGPRHAVFSHAAKDCAPFFYLAAEISATVTAYYVDYTDSGLTFNILPNGVYPSLGPGHAVPPTTTGESTGVTAEIALTPDGRYVIASNRRDASFNTGEGVSDSMATWKMDWAAGEGEGESDGELHFLGLFPAGGEYPRQFSLNKLGNLAAVGLQNSGRVVILERDLTTGVFTTQVAAVDGLGRVTCVVWDE